MASIAFFLDVIGLRGGVKSVYKIADQFILRGHEVVIYYKSGDWKYNCKAKFVQYIGIDEILLTHDAYVATFWTTASVVASIGVPDSKKSYYIQHHEARLSKDYDTVQETYNLPLTKIAISKWVAEAVGADLIVSPPLFYEKFHPHPIKDIDVLMFKTGIWWKGAELSERIYKELTEKGIEVVRICGVTDEELIDLYSMAKIFVFTSSIEGVPAPPLEAMLSGCVLVTSPCTGLDEYTTPKNCIEVEPSGDFVTPIETLLSIPELRKNFAHEAMKDASHFVRQIEENSIDALERIFTTDFQKYKHDAARGERIYPEWSEREVVREHIVRYNFARKYCLDKLVLDVCCGTGYGSYILSSVALSVLGVDISDIAHDFAKKSWKRPNLHFVKGDFMELFRDPSVLFNTVVAFEAVEHFEEGGAFLSGCSRALERDGLLVLSVPPYALSRSSFHKSEFTPAELNDLLNVDFKVLEQYTQLFSNQEIVKGLEKDGYTWIFVCQKR